MSSLLIADFYLVEGDRVKATVEAMNSIDYSIASTLSGDAKVQVKPYSPSTAPIRGSLTNESQIEIIFAIITDDGGAPITTYAIEMDYENSGFTQVT